MRRSAGVHVQTFLLALWIVLGGVLSGRTAERPSPEDLTALEFKAAFLSKIPPYIQWPTNAFDDTGGQLILGIVGKDPFDGLLHQLVKGRKVEGREILIKVFTDPSQITHCQILYIPAASLDEWQKLSGTLDLRGVLTVSERREFLTRQGGVFSLSAQDRKLEIHRQNARKAGLEVNSKLIKISKVVD
jgi:hypothetical protein